MGIAFFELSSLEKIIPSPKVIAIAFAKQRSSGIIVDGLCKTVVVGDSTAHVALIILDVEVMAAILIVACGSIDARQLTTDIFVVSAIFIGRLSGVCLYRSHRVAVRNRRP